MAKARAAPRRTTMAASAAVKAASARPDRDGSAPPVTFTSSSRAWAMASTISRENPKARSTGPSSPKGAAIRAAAANGALANEITGMAARFATSPSPATRPK